MERREFVLGFTSFISGLHLPKVRRLPTNDLRLPDPPPEVAKMASADGPYYEWVQDYLLYDSSPVRSGYRTLFFQEARGQGRPPKGLGDTNMQLSGQLPTPNKFFIRDLSVAFFPLDNLGIRSAQRVWWSTVRLIVGGCQKPYLECPALHVASAFCFMSGAISEEFRGLHRPRLAVPVEIGEWFGVEIEYQGVDLPGLQAAVALRGDYIRAIQ